MSRSADNRVVEVFKRAELTRKQTKKKGCARDAAMLAVSGKDFGRCKQEATPETVQSQPGC